jgi:hypothetical protein
VELRSRPECWAPNWAAARGVTVRSFLGMPRFSAIVGIVLLLELAPACVSSSECQTIEFAAPASVAAAERATTCPPFVAYQGKVFTVSCFSVSPDKLGTTDVQKIVNGAAYHARTVNGVSPDEAIAVSYFRTCGRWQLAFGDISPAELKRIARQVGAKEPQQQ